MYLCFNASRSQASSRLSSSGRTIRQINTSAQFRNSINAKRWDPSPSTPVSIIREALFIGSATSKSRRRSKHEQIHYLKQLLSENSTWHPSWPPETLAKTLDALRLYETRSTRDDTLSLFNKVIHRCQHLSINIPPVLLNYGMELAAKSNSPISMHSYLHSSGSSLYQHNMTLKPWVSIVDCVIAANQDVLDQSWKAKRRKEAWATIVIPRRTNDVRQGVQEPCLFHYFRQHGCKGLAHYFRLVKRFCSSDLVLQLWHEEKGTPDYEIANFILNSCIKILISKRDAKLAWSMASTMSESNEISSEIWDMLFCYPQHLHIWNPAFDKPAMAALNKYVKNIEKKLGVTWIGGVDGFHRSKILDDEIATSILVSKS